ncbi:DUF3261 domain-containing protein [Pseudogulbenkiania sp. MAI-1]|uniref:DUF3261 domain-containing protein n=1 Tax=Pseudogulbenkiania sp. MAI-1 TaxID=990370 RepID=UPI00045EC3F9|nr:DUF3261 domain-containing protein [Pseudogulbenkiania sp. MAI-1]
MRRRLFALCLLPWLAACSRLPSPCPSLPQAPRYCLRPPQPLTEQSQLVTVDGRGLHELSLLRLEGDASRLALAALSPLGQPLLAAAWDGKAVTGHSPFGPRVTGQAAAMLALAQWLNLPEAEVLKGFGRAAVWWRHDADGSRALMHQGDTLMTEAPQGDGRAVRLPTLGLRLDIRELSDDTEAK